MWVWKNVGHAETSLNSGIDFVWKDRVRPVYVMDNHRAALWCWLQEIGVNELYNLIHVDQHWDANTPEKESIPKLEGLSLKEFLGLMQMKDHDAAGPQYVIRWDNFIMPMLSLRPGLKRAFFRVDQDPWSTWDDTDLAQDVRCVPFSPSDFWGLGLGADRLKGRIVLDLDLDYYFGSIGGHNEEFQVKSDEFITKGLSWLAGKIPSDSVVTIALSPDCCGSRAAAIRVCELACQAMGIAPPPFGDLYPAGA